MRRILVCIAALSFVSAATAQEKVEFPSGDGTKISAEIFKPAGDGPFAAVVGLHGCSGMYRDGRLSSQFRDWSKALVGAGLVFMAVDSLGPRGLKSVCTPSDGELRGTVRAQDAFGAAKWLSEQPYVNKSKIGAIGWSHGGGGTLAVATISARPPVEFATAVAFYPPCKPYVDFKARPRIKLTILHGASDNWTPAGPCAEFAKLHNLDFVAYPGAYHNFDWPDLRMTVLRGVGPSGSATIATNDDARQAAIEKTLAIFKAM